MIARRETPPRSRSDEDLKERTPETFRMVGYEGHFGELDGYTVGFETYTDDANPSPLFEGLPDDRC